MNTAIARSYTAIVMVAAALIPMGCAQSTAGSRPFTAAELGPKFDLQHAIRYGMLPTVWVGDDPVEYLKSYVGSYLRQEVQQEALVRNVTSFNRFLEAASFSQGSVLNMQAVR